VRKLGRVLPEAVHAEEVHRKARAQTVLRRWEEVVGSEMAKRSWPDGYTRGTVWVAVKGSAWASELRLIREQILAKLRWMANDQGLFTDIRFGQRKLPDRDEEVLEAQPESLSRDTPLTIREIAERRLAKRSTEGGT
jgi:predicted nucleic acid-binding Zn ribbon protein